jgi:hypothetical protein
MATITLNPVKHENVQETELPSVDCTIHQSTFPLPPCDIDRWNNNMELDQFSEALAAAARAIFPNTSNSRYTRFQYL